MAIYLEKLDKPILLTEFDGIKVFFNVAREYASITELLPDEEDYTDYNDSEIFCAHVTAEKAGIELAEDFLGGCIYEDVKDFYTKYKDDYCADMIKTVLSEAKTRIAELVKELKA